MTRSLQRERVAGVAIVNYTGLIYALLIGSIVFGKKQSTASISGMMLVVIGVFSGVIFSRRQRDLESLESTAA